MNSFTLPPDAQRFLQTPQGAGAETIVRRFHHWMKIKDVIATELSLEEVKAFFVMPFRTVLRPQTASRYKRALIWYLDWLDDNGQLAFDPKQLFIPQRRPLPELAARYVRSLEPTHKHSTRNAYRYCLSQFHECLTDNRISLKQLERAHMEQWMLALSDRGLAPATRGRILTGTRAYICWLIEHHELRADPDDLIRSSDMPKLPTYLPRPLSPAQDAELQQCLEASSDRLHTGLLLMRLTGLRIGELANLSRDCIRVDLHGQEFLKVPLGKLDNERLVPIDDRVAAIVRSLQRTHDCAEPEYLIDNADGDRVSLRQYREALGRACEGIDRAEPITSHRLRHSYATSMLAAGVSLTSVMRLLGHRDIRMTLRYAAITQETVSKEYFEALPNIEARYRDALRVAASTTDFDPIKNLSDISHWIRKHIASEATTQRVARSLLKRLTRIQIDLERQITILDASRSR
jgi:site-specific recombinase XerD